MLTLTRVGSPLADPLHVACLLASNEAVRSDWALVDGFEAMWTLRWQPGTSEAPKGHWFVIADVTIKTLMVTTVGERFDV